MNALANHSFIKMNGLGNEIVVVDMRERPQAITAADARAAAAAAPYDQLMAVYPPRAAGTDACDMSVSIVRSFMSLGCRLIGA
jgi:diaminopimelate epimerase